MEARFKISVIIPVYNAERYIEKCANSLFRQTLLDTEFIFINDCSSDNSLDLLHNIVEKYPDCKKRVRIYNNENNIGAASSRNKGLSVSEGKYITFCDSDDWLGNYGYEKLYLEAIKYDSDIIWSDFYVTDDGKETYSSQNYGEDNISCIRALLEEKMHGALWNKMFKRDFLLRHNIRFNAGADLWEDLYFSVQAFGTTTKIKYIKNAFYHYNICNIQSVSSRNLMKNMQDAVVNTKSIVSFLTQKEWYNEINSSVNILKLASKKFILFSLDVNDFRKWNQIFPEANKYIFSFAYLPFHSRLLGWCASKEYFGIIKSWIFIKKIKVKALK
ncbi:glycosyltransferase family 2 protein [Elizabethkingia anophelis]|uniref:glycosyltransferase family 2 protein n=1 Tax=Elizabethkingia anophelis TaxID=1117645 RepID=UPI0038927FD3